MHTFLHRVASRIVLRKQYRDNSVFWFLEMHPATPEILVSLRLFHWTWMARPTLRRLTAITPIHQVGSIRHEHGGLEHVYCGWRPPGHLAREVQLTRMFSRLHAEDVQRGPFVSDQVVRPDAQLRINGQLYYLELDRGPYDARPIAERLCRYEGCPHPSLWVCDSEDGTEDLRRRAEKLGGAARFATVAEAFTDPHAVIWKDVFGIKSPLPRDEGGPA
jgi:hypothetical protein